MKETTIAVRGYFTKKEIARILKFLWKIQKKVNPKNIKEKYFMIWVSNEEFSDEEVKRIIVENFKSDVEISEIDKMIKTSDIKGLITPEIADRLSNARTPKEFIEVFEKYYKRTSRKCKYCKKSFKRVEDGAFDIRIGDKNICFKCAKKRGLVNVEEQIRYGLAG